MTVKVSTTLHSIEMNGVKMDGVKCGVRREILHWFQVSKLNIEACCCQHFSHILRKIFPV